MHRKVGVPRASCAHLKTASFCSVASTSRESNHNTPPCRAFAFGGFQGLCKTVPSAGCWQIGGPNSPCPWRSFTWISCKNASHWSTTPPGWQPAASQGQRKAGCNWVNASTGSSLWPLKPQLLYTSEREGTGSLGCFIPLSVMGKQFFRSSVKSLLGNEKRA